MKITGIYLLLVLTHYAFSQETVLTASSNMPINLSSRVAVFMDSAAATPFSRVQEQLFVPHQSSFFLIPFSNAAYWIRLDLKNSNAQNNDWVLKWNNAIVEKLDFYVSDSLKKSYQHTEQRLYTTQKLKKLYEEQPHLSFKLLPHTSITIYIKITGKRGHYSGLELHSADSFVHFRYDNFAAFGIINGLIFFRILFIMILGFLIGRGPVFYAYSCQILLSTVAYWGSQNVMGPLFTANPDTAAIINYWCTSSAIAGACIFVLWALEIKKMHPTVLYLLYGLLTLTLILDIMVAVDYQWYWLKAGAYIIIFCMIFILLLYAYSFYKRLPTNTYYSLPFLISCLSYLFIYLRLVGILPFAEVTLVTNSLFPSEFFFSILFLVQLFKNSERQKSQAEQRLYFNLEYTERLKELDTVKTRFFANISHEFRTPLTLILSPLKDLRREFPRRDIFRFMQLNAERLLSLINQLLDLSKLEAGKMELQHQRADIGVFFKYLFSSFESLAQNKNIIFLHEQSRASYIADFDQDKLEKITTNLLSNAFKFTPVGGRVQVRADFNPNDMVLKVEDFGIGIEAQRLPHIFNRFYQADGSSNRSYEGTGIGLALVKELVEVMNGTINVKSTVGKGTEFIVVLPLSEATEQEDTDSVSPSVFIPAEETVRTLMAPGQNNSDGKDILLIVEDNPELRYYMRSLFEVNYQIEEAGDGQEGLHKAIELVPDVVICDLMMPRLDGLGLCKALKTDPRTNHIPIVMLTAKAAVEDRIQGLNVGADDYLAKPFNTEELQIRVQNLLRQRRVLQQKYNRIPPTAQLPLSMQELTPDEKFLEKAREIVQSHFTDSRLDVETFASEMGMSAVQLRRKLKALTDRTVTEYVRNYRLEKAAELLKNKAGTVSEIAYRVGFESLPYFSKVFQDKFGKAPSEWS